MNLKNTQDVWRLDKNTHAAYTGPILSVDFCREIVLPEIFGNFDSVRCDHENYSAALKKQKNRRF